MDATASHDREESFVTSPSSSLQSQSESPIHPEDIKKYAALYPYAAESSYFTRANRYYGPSSTWYSWTANDRAVVEAIDLSRARDLSIHLYNAFALKARTREVSDSNNWHPIAKSTETATLADKEQPTQDRFTPPEVWTAWPLNNRDVPRTNNESGFHGYTTNNLSTSNPSWGLEDALLATTLRYAKNRWNDREDEKPTSPVSVTKRDWKKEREHTKQELRDAPDSHDERLTPSQGPDGISESELEQHMDDEAQVIENPPEGVQFFSSQAFGALDSDSSTEDEMSTSESEGDYPTFGADEDHARKILLPPTRHVLAKLDDLLVGLHKARLAYTVRDISSRSRSRSVFSSVETADDDPIVRSRSRVASNRPSRKRKRSTSKPADVEDAPTPISRGRSRVRGFGKKGRGYCLRDWSDILGMATLTGWNTETISRAAARCAKLFDQNMTFRTFHNGVQERPWFEEEAAYASEVMEDAVEQPIPATRLSVPVDTKEGIEYVRTSSACTRCKTLKQRCEPAVSSGPMALDQLVTCAACISSPDPNISCTGIRVQQSSKASITSTSKTCPYPDCPRHSSTQATPFRKIYHLQRHLKDVHGHHYTPPVSPSLTDNPLSTDNDRDNFDLAIRAQVRSSGKLRCPVPSCPRSVRVFQRSTRLYDHIKKEHPDIDVADLKKIGARSSTRGRYDRSRSRSRARGGDSMGSGQQENEEDPHLSDGVGDPDEIKD